MREAARVARAHRLDPVLVLDEPDPFKRAARIAAAEIIANDMTRARERLEAERERGGPR